MARLPDVNGGADQEVVERIRARRGGDLRPLDRMLLHSPPIADGWNRLLGAIREQTTLADAVRELVILRVAALNEAEYEWQAHEPVAREAGLDDAALAAVRGGGDPAALAPELRAALAFTDAMTRDVRVPAAVFEDAAAHFDDRQLVELTATAGAYNCVSRFLVALEVGE